MDTCRRGSQPGAELGLDREPRWYSFGGNDPKKAHLAGVVLSVVSGCVGQEGGAGGWRLWAWAAACPSLGWEKQAAA